MRFFSHIESPPPDSHNNMARGSETYQWMGTAAHASRAVDGVKDNWPAVVPNYCLETGAVSSGAPSWWAINLKKNLKVVSAVITLPEGTSRESLCLYIMMNHNFPVL